MPLHGQQGGQHPSLRGHANRALTDSPLWIRRIASASAGGDRQHGQLVGTRLAGAIGTVLVQTISSTSVSADSRASASPANRPCVQATRIAADVALAQPVEQLEHRAALGDLVVQHDHVPAGDLADDRADHHLVVGEPLLGAGRHRRRRASGRTPRPPWRCRGRGRPRRCCSGRSRRKCAASSRSACRWSTGTLKKPCTCGECRVIASTRSAPAVASRSATSRPPMEMRGASFLSERA